MEKVEPFNNYEIMRLFGRLSTIVLEGCSQQDPTNHHSFHEFANRKLQFQSKCKDVDVCCLP